MRRSVELEVRCEFWRRGVLGDSWLSVLSCKVVSSSSSLSKGGDFGLDE